MEGGLCLLYIHVYTASLALHVVMYTCISHDYIQQKPPFLSAAVVNFSYISYRVL